MTLLLGFGAVNTGNNLLYLLVSALLGFMAISGVLGHRNLQRLELSLEAPEEVYDAMDTLVGVRVRNRGRLPSFLLQVELSGGRGRIVRVGSGEVLRLGVPCRFAGRGVHREHPLVLSSRFPINFFIRSRRQVLSESLWVFPAPRPCRAAGSEDRPGRGQIPDPWTAGAEGEITRIGEYSGAEPMRMIHWKLSARQDSLKVKVLSASSPEPLHIDLKALPGAGLEEKLRCASFLVGEGLRKGRPVGLRIGNLRIAASTGRHHKLRLLRELACHGQDQNAS